jgi:hypothetical protein
LFLLCLNCGAVNLMDDRFRLTASTADDLAKLSHYQRSILEAMQKQIRERGPIERREGLA